MDAAAEHRPPAVFAWLAAALVVAALVSGGCESLDEEILDALGKERRPATADTPEDEVPCTSIAAAEPARQAGSAAARESPDGEAPASPSLTWRYGAFDGSRAVPDGRCRISALRVGASSLSLHWDTPIPGDWARNRTDKGALVIVAAFYEDATGRWIGGKFDWIDESRNTRSLENIAAGYGGWDAAAFRVAHKRGLVVVSADGKHCSNFITE